MTKESELYPIIKRYLEKKYSKSVLISKINSGVWGGKIDVVLVRGIFGELLNTCEIVTVEAIPDKDRFLNYIGQALGYSIFSDRCYLAVKGEFTQEEIDVANSLGIGLIEINKNSCKQVLDSKLFNPIDYLRLKLLSHFDIHKCSICGSYLIMKNPSRKLNDSIKNKMDYVYYLDAQDEIAVKKGLERRKNVYIRRYICKDCINGIFSEFIPRRLNKNICK